MIITVMTVKYTHFSTLDHLCQSCHVVLNILLCFLSIDSYIYQNQQSNSLWSCFVFISVMNWYYCWFNNFRMWFNIIAIWFNVDFANHPCTKFACLTNTVLSLPCCVLNPTIDAAFRPSLFDIYFWICSNTSIILGIICSINAPFFCRLSTKSFACVKYCGVFPSRCE